MTDLERYMDNNYQQVWDYYSRFGTVNGVGVGGTEEEENVHITYEKLNNYLNLSDVPQEYGGLPVKPEVVGKIFAQD